MHAFIQRRSTMGMLDSQPVYPDKSACETTAGGVMNYRDQREPQIKEFQREAERIYFVCGPHSDQCQEDVLDANNRNRCT